MKRLNVEKTKELDLCVSCEICSAACPKNAVTMAHECGQLLPEVDTEKCIECGLCFDVCPGIDIDPQGLRNENYSDNLFYGNYLESYTAYSNNLEIRKNSTSGGLITTLIIELIKNKEYDASFVLPFDISSKEQTRLKETSAVDEILRSAKSKYIPASSYNVIKALAGRNEKKYIVVATPCQIYGIKKYLKKKNISGGNLLFLGVFCDKTLNLNLLRYFEDTYGKSSEKISIFNFRTKVRDGWPGHSKIYFDSGRELLVDRKVRMKMKNYFQLNRCLFCLDKLNRLADFSFGDCYVQGKEDFYGKSSVIIRSNKGKDIFNKYSHLFTMEKESINEIGKSQHLTHKMDNFQYVRIYTQKYNLYPDANSNYSIDSQASLSLAKLQKHIKWGENYNIHRIKYALFMPKQLNRLRRLINAITSGIVLAIAVLRDNYIPDWIRSRHNAKANKRENVIIVGGQLFNKGAQAMTFITVDQIRRRFPGKNIYLFNMFDYDRPEKEKSIYKFTILPWDLSTKIGLLGLVGKLARKNKRSEEMKSCLREVLNNTDCFIDISGFALSSQHGWFISINYILNIVIAKNYSIPFYILPQSMGPFEYPQPYKIILHLLMKLYLKYPEKIFIREKEGLKCVRKYTTKNIEHNYDLVLQNKDIDLSNIYKKQIPFNNIKIEANSVGIIPNLRVMERANIDEIYSIYESLVNILIGFNKTVYILKHSFEDLKICERIKSSFPDNENVKIIYDDLNVFELECVIKQFDFLIASRYHSIVYAYKNAVPAIVIGWATKYLELLELFNQKNYLFDCRSKININKINESLNGMMQNHILEKETIHDKMLNLRLTNIYDILGKDMSVDKY